MDAADYAHCHELADTLPVVLGLDLAEASQMVRLYLGKDDERKAIVSTIARVLVDNARGLETPFIGQIWVATSEDENTTVAYFQVVGATKATVALASIQKRVLIDEGDHGSCIPLRSRFAAGGQVVHGQLSRRGEITLDDGRDLEAWLGTANFWSSYGELGLGMSLGRRA